jgi:hypothetical protein
MTGHRRAAVALHGLHAADRKWILDALPCADREQLTRYLGELKDLGFVDGEAIADTQVFHPPSADKAGPESPADRLGQASAAQVFACLEREHASLIAQILLIREWRWAEGFLQLFAPLRRKSILGAMAGASPVAPARKKFLVEATVYRLDAAALQTNPGANADVFSPVFSACRRMAMLWIR